MKALCSLYCKLINLSNVTLSPLLDLAIRLYMANIFWKSGKLKLDSYLNGQWNEVVTAFRDYHPEPGVPPELAAIGGTVGEVVLPILLAFGFLTRFGAAGLLAMTLVIQFAVPADYGVANKEHYYWMLLLAVPMLKGGGMFSVDYLLGKMCCKKKACGAGACETETPAESTEENSEKET